MSRFISHLEMRTVGPQRWLLVTDLYFSSDYLRGVVIAPRGFQTDLASIPRFFWRVYPPVGSYDKAAVIHDAGYGNALVTENGDRIFATKQLSDRLFLEGMNAESVPSMTAWPMYQAVVVFGNPLGHPLRRVHAKG